MRVILGYLLREAIPASFAYDTSLDQKWISEIRDYIPSEPIRSGTLYVAQKGTVWGTADEMPGTIPVILPELPSEEIPRSFAPIIPKAASEFRSCIQALRDELHILEKWNLAMYQAACSGCGLEELLNMAGSMTPNHIYIADMSFKVLAYTDRHYMTEMSASWRYQLLHGYLPVHVMKGLIEDGEFEQLDGYRSAAHHYSKSFYVPFATRNIFIKNRPQAHIFVVDMITRPCFKDLVLAQALGDFLEQNFHILSKYRVEQIGRNFEAFFNDVLTGNCTDENVIENQLSLMGWKISHRYGAAIIDVAGRDEGLRNTVMYEIESKTKWMCFHHGDDLVVVSNIDLQPTDSYRPLLKELAERYNVRICIGLPYTGFLSIGVQYRFLSHIRTLARRRTKNCPLYIDARDYGLSYNVDRVQHDPILRSLCSPDAERLRAFDRENGTEYLPTYLTFLLHDRNLVKTAGALHVHRNTLVYRLEKIHEMIGTDEDDPEQKLHMLMSMLVLSQEAEPEP